jgi:LAGLIDADG DNA endonuclease family
MVHTDKPRCLSGYALVNYKSKLALNDAQKEVLTGILLGDGYINYNRTANQPGYYIVFAQKQARASYVDHVSPIL